MYHSNRRALQLSSVLKQEHISRLALYCPSARPHMEYCIQLWGPQHKRGRDLLE